MNYHYDEWLAGKLEEIKNTTTGLEDYIIEVVNEQLFAKKKTLTPKTIYVVVKLLSSTITLNAQTTPIQITVLTEQNSMTATTFLLKEFAEKWNFYLDKSDLYVKHQYSTPVVLSNFNEVANGYRSVLYLTGTLNIYDSMADVDVINIGNETIHPLLFNLSYTMQGNTQQKPTNNISTTIKSVSTQSLSFTVPYTTDSAWLTNVTQIMNGELDGNTSFEFSFTLNNKTFSGNYKLVSATFGTAINELPTLTLGFML